MLNLTDKAFFAFLRSLDFKAPILSTLSAAASEAVLALFEGKLMPSQKLNLEAEEVGQILLEPSSSIRLLRLLKWQEHEELL